MIGRTLHILASTPPLSAPLGLPDWAPWVLIAVGGCILAVWWAGNRASASGQGNDSGAFGRLVRSARHRAQTPAPQTVDPETRAIVDTLLARLDERADRLESLLTDAKRTIARLESIADAAAHSPPAAPPARQRPAAATPEPPEPPAPPVIEIAPGVRSPRTDAADPICTRVYQMADAGDDAVAIARRLDEHVGKVQLILALRER